MCGCVDDGIVENKDQNGRTRWVMSLKNYFVKRDWRLILIDITSVVIAVISAQQLESKFFIGFMSSEFLAQVVAIAIMLGITVGAHAVADNFKRKAHKTAADYILIVVCAVGYILILLSLLGMSNYVMSRTHTEKNTALVNTKVTQAENSLTVVEAKKSRDRVYQQAEIEIKRLQNELESLEGTLYLSRKREFGSQIEAQQRMQQRADQTYQSVLEKETARLETQGKKITETAQEDGIGAVIAKSPASLMLLALIVLFCVRLSFDVPEDRAEIQAKEPMAQIESRKEIHSREIIMAKGEVPVSQVFKKVEPTNLDEACLLYAQGRISAENGWSQRRIAKDFADGNVSLVHAKIKKSGLPLLSSGMSGQDINSV